MHTVTITAVVTWLMLLGVAVGEDRLASERWHDEAYGLSLRPMRLAMLTEPPGDARLRFADADGTQITLFIRQTQAPVDIATIKKKTAQQTNYTYPSSLIVDDANPPDHLAKRPAGRIYFVIPDKQRGDWILGHVFVQIDPYAIADLELHCDAAAFADARKTFEMIADSIEFMNPVELDRIRTEQLEAGQAWIKSIPRERWLGELPREQWLRILEGSKDIGYMRIRMDRAEQLGMPGMRMEIRTHIEGTGSMVDTFGEFFESEDQQTEIWSNRASRRATSAPATLPASAPARPKAVSVAETGLRSDAQIDVTIETSSYIQPHQWETPTIAFLSQIDQRLIGPMLPHQASLAFYTYTAAAQSPTLMTVRTEPIVQGTNRGGYRVTLRPAPTLRQQVITYNAQGQLVEWVPAEGRAIKPTTPDDMRKIWKLPR